MTESSSLVGSKPWDKLDKPTFFGALILLALATVPLMIWPEQGALWVDQAKIFLTDELGLLYLVLGVAAMGFMVFILFSDIGQIKLGEADDPVEFNTVSWAAMLFCGGIGASILYWSMIEWAFYYQNPPFQLAVSSEEAIRWSATFDTISYILASVVQKDVAEEPMRWNRLFWAFALSILPVTLLFMGGLSSLQTAAIVGGLPLLVICVLLMMSIVRAAYLDLFFQDDYEHSVINIADFPDYDPWSNEGMALAKFEQFKDQVVDLVTEEKSLKEDIKKLQKRMRAEALRYAKEGEHSDSTRSIEAMREQMKELKLALERCIESKQLRVQEAKAAKAEFDQLLS